MNRVAIFSTSVKSIVLNQGVHLYWTMPESRLERTTGLEHWFIKIAPQLQTG
ncbi:MAG: hypothetical protein KZQ66_02850 [Candidatus Thiodiazotropha sp. (ex Lucinoma aequizonata)]|nr:hypothetical protein [Candidatus Thiodiazotropha sp. (ex Lucinoma aequizonata)]MCU7889734.1 hypothetical protein [Candidatus Thiodiazotropha sp. (ex Lucinoma aequizonata)]MCU7897140.1 hypothetical protein [Candidatus Thiodiazotropha sp. (ex Lucinoma aequizonata)]MCU7897848.1 hypothetical protein [Candidatus Thiodiazotropha sp. (ex Lucinoma aequizonata)]MCU7901072.1 hypothetical protein [Candidatus Thiodiazotropha sp. (ex Lucinoma aequizonata)]